MHLADGILSAPVTVASTACALAGIARGLYRLEPERVPQVGMMAAVFFVGSLIHVPVGVSSAHLVLNGLVGLFLGWASFPALTAALLLQAILFHFGGMVCLGANVWNMALPAVAGYYLFGCRLRRPVGRGMGFAMGAAAGAFGVFGSGVMMALTLCASGGEFLVPAAAVLAAHIPVMAVEALVTGSAVSFVLQVRPEFLLSPSDGTPPRPEDGPHPPADTPRNRS
ncbi:MAG: cobalt transporter CbiM [Lentisphaeria bacterium]|nr:cobalt transporter CbiM [Lentisphaeria bacterium]